MAGQGETSVPSPVPASPVPTVSPSSTPSCHGEAGQVVQTKYRGTALPQEIPLRVYLPACYRFLDRELPTLYLLHGKPFDEGHWGDLGVVELADGLIEQGAWPPFLIVMPRQPEPLFSSSDGGPGSYEDELLAGLVPFIDQEYATLARADARGIAGISRGGIWALEIGLRNPDVFDRVAALSPALAVNYPRPPYDPFVIVGSGEVMPSRVYLIAGTDDWALSETRRLSRVMQTAGLMHTLATVPGSHDAATWEAALRGTLDFLLEGW